MTSRGAKYWSTGTIPLIAPDLLGSIISSASDIAVVVSDMGQILSVLVNPQQKGLDVQEDWNGLDMREVLTPESATKLERRLAEFASGVENDKPLELNHRGSSGLQFPIRYSFHQVGPDGAILLLGRDLRPIAEMQQQLVEAQLALERDYELNRDIATRMRVLLDISRDAIAFVALNTGRITDLNGSAAQILGGSVEDLKGAAFADELTGGAGTDVLDQLARAGRSDGAARTELTTRRTRTPLMVGVTLFRAAGERMLVCRMDRADHAAAGTQALNDNLARLYDSCAEGIVVTDRSGQIVSANDGFLDLADLDNSGLALGRNLSDFLVRGGVDLKVMSDNAVRNGQIKLYATRFRTDVGVELPVEISVSYLDDAESPMLGFILRDGTRSETSRAAPGVVDDDTMRSIRELVGTASLKELVGETSDVVEKMCIETAVELTGNNRVAAAEMLGLSRQSLYVKLRKYGLLARNDD